MMTVTTLNLPERRLLLRRGKTANNYFDYCAEVGCGTWTQLSSIQGALREPLGMWLPEGMRRPGTSEYVQGIELPAGGDFPVPESFEILELPPCTMLVFQGPPFSEEECCQAIGLLHEQMSRYDPHDLGYEWDDSAAPRFQLEPKGSRGYIEGRPVRRIGAEERPDSLQS
jgi:hypothetical protein